MYPPNTSRRSVLESLPAELTLLAVGVLLGTLGGYALSRVLASRMYGVTPVDPATYIMAIAGFAGWPPSRAPYRRAPLRASIRSKTLRQE